MSLYYSRRGWANNFCGCLAFGQYQTTTKSLPSSWSQRKCINNSCFILNMQKLMQRLKKLKCWRERGIRWGGFWSDLFYKSSPILLHTFLTSLTGSKVHGSAITIPRGALFSWIAFVPPFNSWFIRSKHGIMLWEMHVTCPMTALCCSISCVREGASQRLAGS